MDTKELLKHSKNTKNQAEFLLKSTNILNILDKFGRAYVIGSYSLDVMYGPDIDIIVESTDIRNSSVNALQEIIEKRLFRKIEYGDFVKFPMEKRPHGYIVVLKAVVDDVKWEIEVWFLEDASKPLSEYNFFKSRLNEDKRIKVLQAKHLRETSSSSQHQLRSFEIYEQILGKV